MKKILLFLLVVLSMFSLVACNEDQDTNNGSNNDNQTDVNPDDNQQEEQKPAHTHTYGTVYKSDASKHWYECTDSSCKDKKNAETHNLVVNEETQVIECTVCASIYTSTSGYEHLASMGVDPEEANNAYQVLVYSFYDSDGDGYGDLNGLTSKLDYIKDLGMNLIWLSPIMEC